MSTIALITDFGTVDGFVGSMKGVMLSIAPDAHIVDISHECTPHNTYHAAYVLWSNYKYFPDGTVFVVVVDPGVGSERRIILVKGDGGKNILAPENGILDFILPEIQNPKFYYVNNPEYWLTPTSNTFHGRDIFAPVAAHIVNGKHGDDFGVQVKLPIPDSPFFDIDESTTELNGMIIHSDRFGNLITNIRPKSKRYDNIRHISLVIGDRTIGPIKKTYASGDYGELIAIIGSSGLVEIAVRNSSAHQMLGLRVGDPVIVRSNPD
jgi:S-adenosyl-L-methionine hydrolase (adenosine-forming)